MDRINYTSSGYTPVQVGRVVPRDEDDTHEETPKAAEKSEGQVTNIRSGNARVGIQADTIDGDLTIRW